MSPVFIIQILLFTFSKCDIIWNDPLNSTNGSPVNWTINNEVNVETPYTGILCPTITNCWQFAQPSFAYYIHSTLNYYNITLKYYVSGNNLDNQDECNIYYSIDSTTNWTQIGTSWTTNTKSSLITITLPTSTSNNTGVGIRLAVIHINSSPTDYCYFSNIILEGVPVFNTNPPTTYSPTTTTPTTNAPTTNAPTTHSPTTNAPTTHSPTQYTSQSATHSTTQFTPQSNIQSTVSIGGSESKTDSSMLPIYIGVGCAVFVVICAFIILCICIYGKRKNDQEKAENVVKTMDNNPDKNIYGDDGTTVDDIHDDGTNKLNKNEESKGYINNSYQQPMSLTSRPNDGDMNLNEPITMSLAINNSQQSLPSNPSNNYPQTMSNINQFGSMPSNTNNVVSMPSNANNNSYQQPMSLTNTSYQQPISLNNEMTVTKLEMVAINSSSNIVDNGNNHSSSDDSCYRKQLQYAYEEERDIDINDIENKDSSDGHDASPLPEFDTALHLQVTSQEVLMQDIMKDMNKSQLKLKTEKELMSEDVVENATK